MQGSTKDTLRQRATALIGEHSNVETAHTAFVNECNTRFAKNPEGLTQENYIAAANEIWSEVKLQQGSRPSQKGDAASATR